MLFSTDSSNWGFGLSCLMATTRMPVQSCGPGISGFPRSCGLAYWSISFILCRHLIFGLCLLSYPVAHQTQGFLVFHTSTFWWLGFLVFIGFPRMSCLANLLEPSWPVIQSTQILLNSSFCTLWTVQVSINVQCVKLTTNLHNQLWIPRASLD